ncbi:MAG: DUF4249 family protein [Cyclobacteriaceae bacterium]
MRYLENIAFKNMVTATTSMLKNLFWIPFLSVFFLFSCEDEVVIALPEAETRLVVDAWLTHTLDTQVVKLTYSRSYFDNSSALPGLDAEVFVVDLQTEEIVPFVDVESNGKYIYVPQTDTFAIIGREYALSVTIDGTDYYSVTQLNPAPTIDSITFEYNPADAFIDQEYYIGEFFARDFVGAGNSYWIKTWKNGQFLSDPDEISLAYDAGFSEGAEVDGLVFISPLRTAINEFEEDENGEVIPPFTMGDSVYVELHAISNEAWFFLARVADEINRPGGFSELFATPLANSPTNMISSDESKGVVGFFNMAAISSRSETVREETIRDLIQ